MTTQGPPYDHLGRLLDATGRIADVDIPTALELERLGRSISFWAFWKGFLIGGVLLAVLARWVIP